jgi:hypothetical protein
MAWTRRNFLGGLGVGASCSALALIPDTGVIDVGAYCSGNGTDLDDDGIAKAVGLLSVNGGALQLPARPILISRPMVLDRSRVSVFGYGPSSRIVTRGDIDAVIVRAQRPLEHLLFSDFEIAAEKPVESKSGYGLRFSSPNISYPVVRSVTIRSKYGGIAFDPKGGKLAGGNSINAARLEGINVRDCSGVGVFVSYVLDLFLESVHLEMRRQSSARALWISRWVQALHARTVVCLGGEVSMLCENGGERAPSELRFEDCVFDGATASCLHLIQCSRLRCGQSWISSPRPGARGVTIEGAGAEDIEISGTDIFNIAQFGLVAKRGSSRFRVVSSRIYNCSYQDRGKYDGIFIESGVSNWKIAECFIGNIPDYEGHQRYGIYVADGPSDNYEIRANDLSGNLAGGIHDGGVGSNKRISD